MPVPFASSDVWRRRLLRGLRVFRSVLLRALPPSLSGRVTPLLDALTAALGPDPADVPPSGAPAPPVRRVRTPTILQMEAVECGAAALASILAHYGRWVPLEELRHECGVSRDGSKASNVLRAARKYGIDAKGYKYEDLAKLYELDLPVILFWNFNHFVVLEGFGEGEAHLNDPAQGPRTITLQELDGSYSGVVLTFKPGPEFQAGGDPPNMVPALRRRLVGSEHALLFVMLCGLFLVIPGLVIPTFTRIFIDDFLLGDQAWLIRPLLVFMIATIIVQGVLTWLQRYYLLRLETKLALSTSSRFFNHILRLPAAYFGQRFAGEIGSRVQINDRVARVISGKLATTVIDGVMTIFYTLLMFWYDVGLTFIVMLIAMCNVAAIKLAARARVDASRRLKQDKGKLLGTAMNGLRMIETLKATGSEGEFFGRWAGYYAKSINTEQELGVLGQYATAVPPFVQTASTAAVLVLGGLKVMSGDLTVGMLVAYQTLLTSFTRPLGNFVQFGTTLQELQADMNRLDDVLRYPEDPQYAQERDAERDDAERKVIKLSGQVELKDLTFGYSPLDRPLIENFNLRVEPGRRVALVGGSGSGKSTVAKLVSGLYKPWSGEVLFDGVRREDLARDLIVNSVAVVDQELFLFGGSVAENVTMWDPTIPPLRLAHACRDACIDDVVAAREGGYASRVQEGGGNFSGGQCQRLEIARALVGEPSIIILDEATSALDPTTEMFIDDSMRRRGCTCIIIAHRLSTIRDCDEIVVLERGRVVQRGTHEEMKDVDGPYKRLISLH
ncbi:MAG: NHLP family bacteriocin export ABC transporter peptidase/permease/ATPase subunit [Vicinamibacteraceae bacterium]